MDVVLPRLVARWIVARAHRMVYGDPSRITPTRRGRILGAVAVSGVCTRDAQAAARVSLGATAGGSDGRAVCAPWSERVLVVLGTRDRLVRDSASYVAALAEAGGATLEVKMVETVEGTR